MNIFIRSSRDP